MKAAILVLFLSCSLTFGQTNIVVMNSSNVTINISYVAPTVQTTNVVKTARRAKPVDQDDPVIFDRMLEQRRRAAFQSYLKQTYR